MDDRMSIPGVVGLTIVGIATVVGAVLISLGIASCVRQQSEIDGQNRTACVQAGGSWIAGSNGNGQCIQSGSAK